MFCNGCSCFFFPGEHQLISARGDLVGMGWEGGGEMGENENEKKMMKNGRIEKKG